MAAATKKIGQPELGRFSRLYAFTTENISGYYPLLPIAGSDVLTVTCSGDHIINAYLFGAGSVVGFDINPGAAHFAELKLVALANLSFDKFKQFFMLHDKAGNRNNLAMDYAVYNSLESQLSESSHQFFGDLYQHHSKHGASLRESSLFNNHYDINSLKIGSNPYLQSEELFDQAACSLKGKHTVLLTSSAQDLPSRLVAAEKFNLMLLSNIADYAREQYPTQDYLGAFASSVILPLAGHLVSGGIICASYVYASGRADKSIFRSDIDDPVKRRAVFGSSGLEYIEKSFDSVIQDEKDMIITLQK